MIRYSFMLFLVGALLGCVEDQKQTLRIATAANMQFAIDALTEAFTANTGVECEVIISSSGKLTAQILQGAPYNVFLSADMKYPEQLLKAGKTIGAPEIYAKGNMILWTTQADLRIEHLAKAKALITSPEIKHIALANPKTAPYGRAGLEVLNRLSLFEEVEPKLVFGESIAQTNQFITTQAAELGFTSKSVIYAPHLKTRGQWLEIPDSLYTPIEQGAVLLKTKSADSKDGASFLKFVQSPAATKILNNFGYLTH